MHKILKLLKTDLYSVMIINRGWILLLWYAAIYMPMMFRKPYIPSNDLAYLVVIPFFFITTLLWFPDFAGSSKKHGRGNTTGFYLTLPLTRTDLFKVRLFLTLLVLSLAILLAIILSINNPTFDLSLRSILVFYFLFAMAIFLGGLETEILIRHESSKLQPDNREETGRGQTGTFRIFVLMMFFVAISFGRDITPENFNQLWWVFRHPLFPTALLAIGLRWYWQPIKRFRSLDAL